MTETFKKAAPPVKRGVLFIRFIVFQVFYHMMIALTGHTGAQ